jgi:hypothetical protein
MLMRQLVDEVERSGAVGLIHIGEYWAAPLDAVKAGQPPSAAPGRKESLQVTAATHTPESRVGACVFLLSHRAPAPSSAQASRALAGAYHSQVPRERDTLAPRGQPSSRPERAL